MRTFEKYSKKIVVHVYKNMINILCMHFSVCVWTKVRQHVHPR
jgi:hypothetical protein